MSKQQNEGSQLSPLSEVDIALVELRYEGHSYPEMIKAIQERFPLSKVQTYGALRQLFCKNGRLHAYYSAFALEQNKARIREAHGMFKAHSKNAVRTLVQVMNKSKLDVARVQAAKELLVRSLGEAPKIIINPQGDPADALLKKMGIIDDDGGETGEDI